MDNYSSSTATQDNRVHPPIYVKYKVKNGYEFAGPHVTLGSAQTFVARCEYVEKGIEFSYVGLEEKNSYAPPEPVAPPEKKGPGRPRKEVTEE